MIEAQTLDQGTGSFTFDLSACCDNSLTGNGRLAADGTRTELTQLSNPNAYPGDAQIPPDDLAVPVSAFVGPDAVQVDVGGGWQSFSMAELESPSYENLADSVAVKAQVMHEQLNPHHALSLIAATPSPNVATSGDLTTYSGTADLAALDKDEFAGELYDVPQEGFTIEVTYEVTVDEDYVLQKMVVTEQVNDHDQPLPPTELSVTYSDWGRGAALAPPT